MTAYIRVKGVNDDATRTVTSWWTNSIIYLEGIYTVAANDVLNVYIYNESGNSRAIAIQTSCSFVVEYLTYS